MSRFAIRITNEILEAAKQYSGFDEPLPEFEVAPYLVITPLAPGEFHLKMMTEEEMLNQYRDDTDLHVV
jgi:hypothetical protein